MTVQQATGVCVYVSTSGIGHIDLDCSSLGRMRQAGADPADALTCHEGRSYRELFDPDRHEERILECRVCALEESLTQVWQAVADQPGAVVFVVTALGSPDPGAGEDRASRTLRRRRSSGGSDVPVAVRELAAARARRLASAWSLNVTGSPHGAVLYGYLSEPALAAIGRHVHVDTPPAPGSVMPEQVCTYWTLRRETDLSVDAAWMVAAGVCA